MWCPSKLDKLCFYENQVFDEQATLQLSDHKFCLTLHHFSFHKIIWLITVKKTYLRHILKMCPLRKCLCCRISFLYTNITIVGRKKVRWTKNKRQLFLGQLLVPVFNSPQRWRTKRSRTRDSRHSTTSKLWEILSQLSRFKEEGEKNWLHGVWPLSEGRGETRVGGKDMLQHLSFHNPRSNIPARTWLQEHLFKIFKDIGSSETWLPVSCQKNSKHLLKTDNLKKCNRTILWNK